MHLTRSSMGLVAHERYHLSLEAQEGARKRHPAMKKQRISKGEVYNPWG
uniref:Uncharacterized protein n=1 Tax=Arundo donax TaxID=35708 RepID=A0A0A9FXZ0_ARUDO